MCDTFEITYIIYIYLLDCHSFRTNLRNKEYRKKTQRNFCNFCTSMPKFEYILLASFKGISRFVKYNCMVFNMHEKMPLQAICMF